MSEYTRGAERWCRDGHKLRTHGWKGYWKARAHFQGPWWRGIDTTRLYLRVYCERCGHVEEICIKDTNPVKEQTHGPRGTQPVTH